MEGGEIISDKKKTTEIFNDHFTNIVKNLNIPDIKLTNQSVNNKYLLTGNKVALFSTRQTRDILLPER